MVAIDQWGGIVYVDPKRPRASLMEQVGRKRAYKMYVDKLNGDTCHIGYIVAGRWFTLYRREERTA
jgi:hypothetical protein